MRYRDGCVAIVNSLTELLGLPENTRPMEVARAVECMEVMLRYQAKQGSEEASTAMLRLRHAYLLWAYGPHKQNAGKAYATLAHHG